MEEKVSFVRCRKFVLINLINQNQAKYVFSERVLVAFPSREMWS